MNETKGTPEIIKTNGCDIIITKKEFMNAIQEMSEPIIETGCDHGYPFTNRHFILRDKNDLKKKLYLHECRLSWAEWDAGKVDNCITRIEAAETKFNKWLEDATKKRRVVQRRKSRAQAQCTPIKSGCMTKCMHKRN